MEVIYYFDFNQIPSFEPREGVATGVRASVADIEFDNFTEESAGSMPRPASTFVFEVWSYFDLTWIFDCPNFEKLRS